MPSFNHPFNRLLEKADILAIKALDAGNANERQQKIALNAIFNKICRVGRQSFEENQATAAFNEGVRYVGIQIHSAVHCDIDKLQLDNPINKNRNK
jgi:hypothetical protein